MWRCRCNIVWPASFVALDAMEFQYERTQVCVSSVCSILSLCASREDARELADANAYSQKCRWLQVFCVRLASACAGFLVLAS